MDGATIASLIVAAGALASSVGGVAVQLRRSDPENVKLLKQRVESAEARAEAADANVNRLRDQLLVTEGRLFAFERLANRRGWDLSELQTGEAAPEVGEVDR